MLTYDILRHDESIKTYIRTADAALAAQGYTEHSFAHVTKVAETAGYIMSETGHTEHEVEQVKIAAYLHDIGNLVNRVEHSQSGAVMAFRILLAMDMDAADVSAIVSAIGNHDEGCGVPVNDISAALILADKSDVRRSRVRNRDMATFDIHDRVNYSVSDSSLAVDKNKKEIVLRLTIDTEFASVMEYFEIFLERMLLCRKASDKLGYRFRLYINDQKVI
jgi:metal-dependent HD superfamily phosphatase/phosphodiesterase